MFYVSPEMVEALQEMTRPAARKDQPTNKTTAAPAHTQPAAQRPIGQLLRRIIGQKAEH